MKLLHVVHCAHAGALPTSIAAPATVADAPAFTAALPDNQIPVTPLVLVSVHLSGFVYVGDAALELRFAQLVQQAGVLIIGEPHPTVLTVLLSAGHPGGRGRGSAGLPRRRCHPVGSW